MSGEPPVGHPCHQLSNPSAQLFWCRHCMTGFPDPMQRWRHSKECKAISTQKKYGGYNHSNQQIHPFLSKYESPTPSPQSETSTPNKKKRMDLKCYICKKEFVTINEMRDHVKRPCNKPEMKNELKDTFDSLISANEEDSDDSVSQNEDKVTNQIETLLKAAQILQQKKDQLKQFSNSNGSSEQISVPENSDIDQDSSDLKSQYTMLDLVKRAKVERKKNGSQKKLDGNSEDVNSSQVMSNADKLDEALKIYDFISDTPEPSPHPLETCASKPEMSPLHLEQSPCQQGQSPHGQEVLPCDLETTICKPDASPCNPDLENDGKEISTESLNKTYIVSSHQPQTSDCNKIPKITLKLVTGEKPKSEVWGIGAALPKRIRKRKSKDFFDDFPTKIKKKEMTLKEMQDKLLKNKVKQKIDNRIKLKINKKEQLITDVKDIEIEKESPLESDIVSENKKEKNNNKTKKKNDIKTKTKEAKNAKTLKTRNDGKKNLVVVLTDCLSNEKTATDSKKPTRAARSVKKAVNGKQKPLLKTKVPQKQKNGKVGTKERAVVNSNKAKDKKSYIKESNKTIDRKTEKSKTAVLNSSKTKPQSKQKPATKLKASDSKKNMAQKLKNEKPVKCKACERTFKTRDMLIKHNQIPCRMRNTRTMTQIILRPKKSVVHTLPLTQRQINAAKRRKQIAGKLSILDNSTRGTVQSERQSEKQEKPKKSAKSRKRLISPYFTFCITPKDKSQIFEPLDCETLSEKDRYFYKLGMFSISLRKTTEEKVENSEVDKAEVSEELKPCEITIDSHTDIQSLPSFTSNGSEISPPILEKVSEISKNSDVENDSAKVIISQESLDPPDIVNILSAADVKRRARDTVKTSLSCQDQLELTNSPSFMSPVSNVVSVTSPYNGQPCQTPPSDGAAGLLVEIVKSPTITNGANSSIAVNSSQEEKCYKKVTEIENDKENRGDNIVMPEIIKRDVGVSCDGDDILKEMENCKYFDGFSVGLKLIKPRGKALLEKISKDAEISSQTRSSHCVAETKFGTNRKLTYTVTLGIQTERSFLKMKSKPLKSTEKESLKCKESQCLENENKKHTKCKENLIPEKEIRKKKELSFLEKSNAKSKESPSLEKSNENSKESLTYDKVIRNKSNSNLSGIKSTENVKEKQEERNLFHSIADLISVPVEKKGITPQEALFDSILPSPKVTFDDILEIGNAHLKKHNYEKAEDISDRQSITEVEIVLPKGSKIAQLCTDIDWLESADLRPVKSAPIQQKVNVNKIESSISASTFSRKDFNYDIGQKVTTSSSETDLSFMNKAIPNFCESKHVCDIFVSSTPSIVFSDSQKSIKDRSKPEEVYVYPNKPIMSTEIDSVSVRRAQPSKVDEELNKNSSNNLLELIAKTMGTIPEEAKQKFEKSVMSLLTSATSPMDTMAGGVSTKSKRSKEGQIIIMNNTTDSDLFSSDITVIDDEPTNNDHIAKRICNDRVIRPSNFCTASKFENKSQNKSARDFSSRNFIDLKRSQENDFSNKTSNFCTASKLQMEEENTSLRDSSSQNSVDFKRSQDNDFSNKSVEHSWIHVDEMNNKSETCIPIDDSSEQFFQFCSSANKLDDVKRETSSRSMINFMDSNNTYKPFTGFNDTKSICNQSWTPISQNSKMTTKQVPTLVSENSRTNLLLTPPIHNIGSNFNVKSDSLASRRRSPRPPNIITNNQVQLNTLNNGNKDDIHDISDTDSPTLVTNFDFEDYAEHLKEETFFTTDSLSPIPPVSIIPSSEQPLSDILFRKSPGPFNYSKKGNAAVITHNVAPLNLIQSPNNPKTVQKSEAFLKPLAIDCNQSKEDESYICDISPPLEGPTHISPIDLAKVASAKMTNELILKSQGFGHHGLLQLSNRSMPSPNIALLQQKSPQIYGSPKNFSPLGNVDQQKSIQDYPPIIQRGNSQDNSILNNHHSHFDTSFSPVQLIDVHLNTYKPNSIPSSKVFSQNRQQPTAPSPDVERWDKRQNVIVSPSFNQNRPKNVENGQDLSKQKQRHNVNILRNNNKPHERRQSLPAKTNYLNSNQQQSMAPEYVVSEKSRNTSMSTKSDNYINSCTEPQDAILDMIDKSNKFQNHFVPKKNDKIQPNSNAMDKIQDQFAGSRKNVQDSSVQNRMEKLQDHFIPSKMNKIQEHLMSRKSDKVQDRFLTQNKDQVQDHLTSSPSSNVSPGFQYQRKHQKMAAHHRQTHMKNSDSSSGESPKSSSKVDPYSRVHHVPQHEALSHSQRKYHDHSHGKSKFQNTSRIPHQEMSTQSLHQKEQTVSKGRIDKFQPVLQQSEALSLSTRLCTEQAHHQSSLSNMHRSQSFDQPHVKSHLSFQHAPPCSEQSAVCSPIPSSSASYVASSKGSVFDFQNSIHSVRQISNQGLLSNSNQGLEFTGLMNRDRFSNSQVHRQMSAPCNLTNKPKVSSNVVPNTDYEDVSSPEEVEVYPTTPQKKEIPQKLLPPYQLENETISIHSSDKGQSSRVNIPEHFDFKSSLNPRVQYVGQRNVVDSGNRVFQEQRRMPPNFYLPPRLVHKPSDMFDPSVQFEFGTGDISDSILDNI
ncbi:uncharacterized protein LOC143083253 [Mytilus galloprovincialis]|uniref:uncharacterized protein LOC143083253 n=1 Tax=Mytilus galloprovincialis TaxID=29158 RepID=UPI003F7C251E